MREGESTADDDFRRGVTAILDYGVEDDIARLRSVTDHNDDELTPALLRTLPAGERAVESVPGVERAERAEETLGAVIEDGRKAVDKDDAE